MKKDTHTSISSGILGVVSGITHAKKQRILAINDNPSHIQDWKQLFEEGSHADISFEVDSARQGQEGLQKIRQAFQEGHPYVVALIDVRMPPGWDGVRTIERIWAEYPDLPVIIHAPYSDYSAPEIIERLGTSEKLLIFKNPPDNKAIHRFAVAITKEWECKQATQFEQVLMQASKLPWARILDPDWIRKLAENGDVLCMFYLGNLYLYGREGYLHEQGGFQQDRSQAIRWLREAASLGNKDAKDKLAEIGEMTLTDKKMGTTSKEHAKWLVLALLVSVLISIIVGRFSNTPTTQADIGKTDSIYNQGLAYESKGQLDRAISDYTRATQINPELAEDYYNRGNRQPTYGDSHVTENGSYYGQISENTGRPKTVHVRGYYRKDGTYVRSHYRSPPGK